MSVLVEASGPVTTFIIDRPERRNAVDPAVAAALRRAFDSFEADEAAQVAVLTGAGGHFCAGFDLKALAAEGGEHDPLGEGPMGPTRRLLAKPVIAAVEGYAVAGGLELACGAICAWLRKRPSSACSADAGVCR
jgi:enoyl-CoA hydratase